MSWNFSCWNHSSTDRTIILMIWTGPGPRWLLIHKCSCWENLFAVVVLIRYATSLYVYLIVPLKVLLLRDWCCTAVAFNITQDAITGCPSMILLHICSVFFSLVVLLFVYKCKAAVVYYWVVWVVNVLLLRFHAVSVDLYYSCKNKVFIVNLYFCYHEIIYDYCCSYRGFITRLHTEDVTTSSRKIIVTMRLNPELKWFYVKPVLTPLTFMENPVDLELPLLSSH